MILVAEIAMALDVRVGSCHIRQALCSRNSALHIAKGSMMPVITIRVERSNSGQPVRRRRPRRVFAVLTAIAAASLATAGLAGATGSLPTTPSVYSAISPVKILINRSLAANGSAKPIAAGGTSPVPITATAVVVSVVISGGTTNGTLDVYPYGIGSPQPSVQWAPGQSETQDITVPVGDGGRVAVKNLVGNVTVTLLVRGYFAPPDTPTTYVTSPVSANFLWNSQYIFETSQNSYTEYFTRYDDVSVPALTQSALDSGSLQVFMTPSPIYNPNQWAPLPYQFDSSFGFTYNFVYVARPGHVVLMLFFIQTDPNATLPTLSTYPVNSYHFKIVVTPNSAGASSAGVVSTQRPQSRPVGHTSCASIPGGKRCTVTP
jgi:hypothetical protein